MKMSGIQMRSALLELRLSSWALGTRRGCQLPGVEGEVVANWVLALHVLQWWLDARVLEGIYFDLINETNAMKNMMIYQFCWTFLLWNCHNFAHSTRIQDFESCPLFNRRKYSFCFHCLTGRMYIEFKRTSDGTDSQCFYKSILVTS